MTISLALEAAKAGGRATHVSSLSIVVPSKRKRKEFSVTPSFSRHALKTLAVPDEEGDDGRREVALHVGELEREALLLGHGGRDAGARAGFFQKRCRRRRHHGGPNSSNSANWACA